MSKHEMTPEQLATIQARADAATEGPWETDPQWQDPATGFVSYGVFAQDDTGLAGYDDPLDKDDAEFIANARTDVPALLALVREQAAKLERVETLAEEHARVGYRVTPEDIRAALTATEGAA